ncbi:MAG: hypothetical protein Q9203_005105 [Teloschistes exilis]
MAKKWAWQNPHTTKKIPDDQRIDKPKEPRSPQTSPNRRHQKQRRPQVTIQRALTNLHLLLRVPSFNRLPLAVRFFSTEVYKDWLRYNKSASGELRAGLEVYQPSTAGDLDSIDVTYAALKPHLEESLLLRTNNTGKRCSVCAGSLDLQSSMLLTCPSQACQAVSHMTCLAKSRPVGVQDSYEFLPLTIQCPQCNKAYRWIDIVKELSIRLRGEKESARLTKAPRGGRSKMTKAGLAKNDSEAVGSKVHLMENAHDLKSGTEIASLLVEEAEDTPLSDDWLELEEDDDNASITSAETRLSSHYGSLANVKDKEPKKLEIVIEDSEWDSAELLD